MDLLIYRCKPTNSKQFIKHYKIYLSKKNTIFVMSAISLVKYFSAWWCFTRPR